MSRAAVFQLVHVAKYWPSGDSGAVEILALVGLVMFCSQVAEVEMPRLCQEAREVLQMALATPPDTAALQCSEENDRVTGRYGPDRPIGPMMPRGFTRREMSYTDLYRILQTILQGITGQDVQRGTFAHRHCVIKDQATGEDWCFLQNLDLGPQEQRGPEFEATRMLGS
eukprot:s2528_g25.t1